MKNKLRLLVIAAFATGAANAQFIDLSTGQQVTLVKHQGNGMMLNTQTQKPVYLYVNAATGDTLYGRNGAVVNGRILRDEQGKYKYNDESGFIFDDGEYRMLTEADSSGFKRKVRADGGQKIKYDDYKRKVDGDGDVKAKDGEAKVKDYEDGRLKVKDGEYRKKIDGEGNYREGDDSLKVKLKADGKVKVKDKSEDYKGKIKDDKVKEKEAGEKRKTKGDKVKVKNDEEAGNDQ